MISSSILRTTIRPFTRTLHPETKRVESPLWKTSLWDVLRNKGLNLLSAPGNDLVAATALAASGAHVVLFTTGRGTPFACPVPTMKISTNSNLAGRKSNWIDFNAGVLVEDKEMDDIAEKFFDYVITVASGEKVASEKAGFHDMAIFKQGVTL